MLTELGKTVDKYREILIRNQKTKKEPVTTENIVSEIENTVDGDFPDSPIFKTLPLHCKGYGFNL